MKNSNWKKVLGATLGILVIFSGAVGLTGCEVEEEAPLEQEQDD